MTRRSPVPRICAKPSSRTAILSAFANRSNCDAVSIVGVRQRALVRRVTHRETRGVRARCRSPVRSGEGGVRLPAGRPVRAPEAMCLGWCSRYSYLSEFSGSKAARASSRSRTPAILSMICLAASPGTAVEPMWWMPRFRPRREDRFEPRSLCLELPRPFRVVGNNDPLHHARTLEPLYPRSSPGNPTESDAGGHPRTPCFEVHF
jgi:hypothetical protein